MRCQGSEFAAARLNDQQLDDVRQWVELDRQQKQLTERLHSRTALGHQVSQQLETVWHEKALITDRPLSVLAP